MFLGIYSTKKKNGKATSDGEGDAVLGFDGFSRVGSGETKG